MGKRLWQWLAWLAVVYFTVIVGLTVTVAESSHHEHTLITIMQYLGLGLVVAVVVGFVIKAIVSVLRLIHRHGHEYSRDNTTKLMVVWFLTCAIGFGALATINPVTSIVAFIVIAFGFPILSLRRPIIQEFREKWEQLLDSH